LFILILHALAGAPDPLRTCVIRNASEHSLQVSCLPGNDGGLQQTFDLQMQQLTADQLAARTDLHRQQQSHQPFLTLELDERQSSPPTYPYATKSRSTTRSASGASQIEQYSSFSQWDTADASEPVAKTYLFEGNQRNFSSTKAQFAVSGLRPGSSYLCTVTARNARGASRAYILLAQTLAAPESMNRKATGKSLVETFLFILTLNCN
jgi:hypothetical protein